VVLFLRRIKDRTRKFGKAEQHERSVMVKWISQSFGGLKDVRILNREAYFQSKFYKSVDKTAEASLYNQVVSNVPKPLIETVSVLAMLGIIVYLLGRGNEMESVISVLVLFGAAFIRLMPAVQSLASNYSYIKYSSHSIHPIYNDLVKLRRFESETGGGREVLRFSDLIEVRDLSFSYPNSEKKVLSNVNLVIRAGESIAFVGPSGSGKTTLVDILMGLIPLVDGAIYVDGKNINQHSEQWFRNIGYVPQSIYLIDDTIRRNIALGVEDKDIDESRLQRVLEDAQLKEFIEDLDEGLSTSIGERGVRLSGGQRQRIGIARALYHDPQILVFDEATSALDNVTERYVIEAIERFRGKRTVIMIAHRLSTVKKCDRLYFMRNGVIVNHGTYDELVEKDIDFKRIALF
jgi:ATP-binding cassette, subfamily B, bacterial PglK